MELLSQIAQILIAFVMMFIAAAVAYIAHLQYCVNRERFKSELFDKRYEVYKATDLFLSSVLNSAFDPLLKENHKNFCVAKMKSQFLFDEDIKQFLDSLWEHVSSYGTILEIQKGSSEEERDMFVKKASEIKQALKNEYDNLGNRFNKYLRLPYLENPFGKFIERLLNKIL